jgi:multidrug efflux pump subunit AcrA (membrane-fusion protein)
MPQKRPRWMPVLIALAIVPTLVYAGSRTSLDLGTRVGLLEQGLAATNMQVAQNTMDIAQNQMDIAQNQMDIAQNQMDIAQNATDIAQLQTDVAQNTMDIAQNQTDIAQNQTDIAQNAADIAALQAGGFRRLGGTGFTFMGTNSSTFTPIASVTIPANTITDFILVTSMIDQNSLNTGGTTAEIQTELQINGVAQVSPQLTQNESGIFVVTLSFATFAQAFVPSPAEKAAPLTVTILGRSPDGRNKNFNLRRLDVLGR